MSAMATKRKVGAWRLIGILAGHTDELSCAAEDRVLECLVSALRERFRKKAPLAVQYGPFKHLGIGPFKDLDPGHF